MIDAPITASIDGGTRNSPPSGMTSSIGAAVMCAGASPRAPRYAPAGWPATALGGVYRQRDCTSMCIVSKAPKSWLLLTLAEQGRHGINKSEVGLRSGAAKASSRCCRLASTATPNRAKSRVIAEPFRQPVARDEIGCRDARPQQALIG